MACVEGVPAVSEIGLEPGAEIHGCGIGRDSDVAEIAGAIARGHVHAAAKRDGKMGEVAANALPVLQGLVRGLGGIGVLIAEGDVVVNEVADGLDQRPAFRHFPEFRPGKFRQSVGVAVAAAEEINQRLDRQSLERALHRVRRHVVGIAAVLHKKIRRNRQPPGGRLDHVANIPEAVAIFLGGNERVKLHPIRCDEVPPPARMDAQCQDHWRWLRAIVGNCVTGADCYRHLA